MFESEILNAHWKLVSFDLDGTLIKGTSTGKHIARQVGHLQEMQQLEFLYHQGKVTNADVAAFDGKYLRGYSKQGIHEILKDIPTIGHISSIREACIESLAAGHCISPTHGSSPDGCF